MHSSNLIKLLAKLDATEWKRFDKFLRSPYFNSSKSVIQLFELLKKYHPAFDVPKLDKEKVFLKIFPNQSYKEKKMWQLMSDLKGLAEQFLVVEKNNRQNNAYQMQLRAVFFEKDLFDWFEKKSEQLNTQLAKEADLINEFYLHQINDDLYYNNHNSNNENNPPSLLAANEHLQYYFYLQQLRYACEWLSRNKRHTEALPPFVPAITYRAQYQNRPLYQLYYDVFILFFKYKENLQDFEAIIHRFKQHLHLIPRKHQIAILLYLINFSSKQLQRSKEAYRPLNFELYKIGLEEQRLIYKGVLSKTTFMNIVSVASILKEFEWVDQFVKAYSAFLPKDNNADFLSFANASINIRKENYSLAISILNELSFNSDLLEIAKRSLQIRACLGCIVQGDLSYYDLLINKALSFEKFLHRKTHITKYKKTVYFNASRMARRIAKLIYEKAPMHRFQELARELIEMNEIGAKDWFINQIQLVKLGRTKITNPSPKKPFKHPSHLLR